MATNEEKIRDEKIRDICKSAFNGPICLDELEKVLGMLRRGYSRGDHGMLIHFEEQIYSSGSAYDSLYLRLARALNDAAAILVQ